MKSMYKIEKEVGKLEVQIEKTVIEKLSAMSEYTPHTVSELVNTAVKRFISAHKDFLPPKSTTSNTGQRS